MIIQAKTNSGGTQRRHGPRVEEDRLQVLDRRRVRHDRFSLGVAPAQVSQQAVFYQSVLRVSTRTVPSWFRSLLPT